MSKEIQIFNHPEFGGVRVIGDADNPQFCLSDVCKTLDLTVKGVVQRLNKEVISTYPLETAGGIQQMYFVNEDGLYDVILDSRKPEAKRFRKWVTSEVLPSIRKTGSYSLPTKEFITEEEIIDNSLDQTQEPKFSEFHIKDKGKIIATLYFDSRLPDIISIAPEETVIII